MAALAPVTFAADPPPVTVTNIGLCAEHFRTTSDGAFVLFVVDEAGQGHTDLNGDGDALDLVLHVHDAGSSSTTNLGLAVTASLAVAGHLVTFHLSEADHGQTDANGDGDAADVVPHIYDADLQIMTNLGIAGGFFPPMVDDGRVLFEVIESDEGQTDLNGDGDTLDSVLHVHDIANGVTTNLGLAVRASFGGPTTRLDGDIATVIVSEADHGATDLNGDGDLYDGVAFAIDLPTSSATNLGLAAPWTTPALIFGDTVLVLVDESDQGQSDLNADGDRFDLVPHLYRQKTPPITNLGITAVEPAYVDGVLVFSVSETEQGGMDFNGDGDGKDLVLFTYDLETDTLKDLGLTSVLPLVDTGRIAFGVYEPSQGNTDLNGDGDATDWILHVHEVATGVTTNLATEGIPTTFQRRRIGFLANEYEAGQNDLNGDGDVWISEQVPHVYDLTDDTVRNLGVAGVLGTGFDDRMLVRIDEHLDGGVDRNGDGDAFDDVLQVYEGDYGTTIDLGLDGALAPLAGPSFAFSVSEMANGSIDRNGDGDAADWVLHVAHLNPGTCGSIRSYGTGCQGVFGAPPELLLRGCSRAGYPIALTILRGAPFTPAFVMFSAKTGDLPMGLGCSLLVSPPLPLFLGPIKLSSFGSARVEAQIPATAPSGTVRMQAIMNYVGVGPIVTNGIEFEIE